MDREVTKYYDSIAEDYDERSNKFARDRFREEISHYIYENDAVLELGCGSGMLLSELNAKKKVGIDSSPGMIRQPNWGGVTLLKQDAEKLKFRNRTFDVVYSVNLLEHTAHPERVISEAERVLKESGKLIIITPNGDMEFILNIIEWLGLKIPEGKHRFISKKELFTIIDKKRVMEYKTLVFGLFHYAVVSQWVR